MLDITYIKRGDYLYPDFGDDEAEPVNIGKYGRLRANYLKQHRKVIYFNLLTTGTIYDHLAEINQTAKERIDLITKQLAERDGITQDRKYMHVNRIN
jgi:hypothetical protein